MLSYSRSVECLVVGANGYYKFVEVELEHIALGQLRLALGDGLVRICVECQSLPWVVDSLLDGKGLVVQIDFFGPSLNEVSSCPTTSDWFYSSAEFERSDGS